VRIDADAATLAARLAPVLAERNSA
jgi:hypothetical protein